MEDSDPHADSVVEAVNTQIIKPTTPPPPPPIVVEDHLNGDEEAASEQDQDEEIDVSIKHF